MKIKDLLSVTMTKELNITKQLIIKIIYNNGTWQYNYKYKIYIIF